MGRVRKAGERIVLSRFQTYKIDLDVPRMGLVLGTGWSDPDVLKNEGFVLQREITFEEVGINPGNGAGHPNRFLLGTWHGQDVVISQGRVHLYQERAGQDSLIRKWMSVLLALMGDGKQIVLTCSVGGLSRSVKTGMVVQPVGLVSAHLPQPYLSGSDGEFVMSEHLLWLKRENYGIDRMKIANTFAYAAEASGFEFERVTHMLIPGPGFGGASERKLWATQGCDTVGMSLDPELRLLALENMDNHDPQNPCDYSVLAALIVTDDHDLPDHQEIQAEAHKRAPKLGRFLSAVVKRNDW